MPLVDAEPCTLAIVRRRDVPTPSPGPTLIDAVTYFTSGCSGSAPPAFSPSMRRSAWPARFSRLAPAESAVDGYLARLLAVVVTAAAEVTAFYGQHGIFRWAPYVDPATAEEHYHLAATDYTLILFLRQVAREVNTLSPRSTLRVEATGDAVFDDVLHGRIDLSFYVATPPPAFRHELLFEDASVCVMSADHPLAKRKRLTLNQYLDGTHLVIDIIDGDQPLIAKRLAELGVARRASVTLPLFVGAESVLPGTNLIATLNTRQVDRYATDPALAVVAAPIELEPFQYLMYWHPRLDHDPAQEWLRDRVRVVTTTLRQPVQRARSD